MRPRIGWLLLAFGLFSAPTLSQTPADAGIVTFLSGEVKLKSSSGDESVPKPYSRVRVNDRITLAAGARLRVLYLQSGSSELWNGPTEFSIANGTHKSARKPSHVQPVPVKVRAKLQIGKNGRLGGVAIRSLNAKSEPPPVLDAAQLAEIREMYSQLRKEFPSDDITPEVYLSMAMQQFLPAQSGK